jgi:hypothetical protein
MTVVEFRSIVPENIISRENIEALIAYAKGQEKEE